MPSLSAICNHISNVIALHHRTVLSSATEDRKRRVRDKSKDMRARGELGSIKSNFMNELGSTDPFEALSCGMHFAERQNTVIVSPSPKPIHLSWCQARALRKETMCFRTQSNATPDAAQSNPRRRQGRRATSVRFLHRVDLWAFSIVSPTPRALANTHIHTRARALVTNLLDVTHLYESMALSGRGF